jgi:hypothetical protein
VRLVTTAFISARRQLLLPRLGVAAETPAVAQILITWRRVL